VAKNKVMIVIAVYDRKLPIRAVALSVSNPRRQVGILNLRALFVEVQAIYNVSRRYEITVLVDKEAGPNHIRPEGVLALSRPCEVVPNGNRQDCVRRGSRERDGETLNISLSV
jgi:hypothetical protein